MFWGKYPSEYSAKAAASEEYSIQFWAALLELANPPSPSSPPLPSLLHHPVMSASHVQGPWTCARLRLMSNLADPPFLDRGKKILMLSQGLPWLLSPTHFFPEKKEKNNSALDNQSAGWEDYVRCEQSIKSDQQIWNYLLWSPSGRWATKPPFLNFTEADHHPPLILIGAKFGEFFLFNQPIFWRVIRAN